MLLDADDSQLVLVDYQLRLMPAIFESQQVIANAVRLARLAAALQVPLWGTEQMSEKAGLGPNVPEIQTLIEGAGGRVLQKMHFSAVADGLADMLRPPVRKTPAGGNARSLPKHLQKNARVTTATERLATLKCTQPPHN